jgi:hypothetical protein
LAVLVACAITYSPPSHADPDEQAANPSPLAAEAYAYDARVAWINAGELSLQVTRDRQEYEFTGSFKTSREMSAYYTWNGIFAGVGRWGRFGPTSDAYLARTVSKDTDLKIVVMSRDGVRRLDGLGSDFESVTKPAGNDLISALFFSPQCQSDGLVHDGEDEYSLTLRSQQSRDMDDGDDYYEGIVTDCEYLVTDRRERKRKVIVSLAEIDGQMMAVRVRAKIPIWPDPIFRLKTPRPANGPKVASVDQHGARQID